MFCVTGYNHLVFISNPTIPAFKLRMYYKVFLNQDVYVLPSVYPKSFADEFFKFENNVMRTTYQAFGAAWMSWMHRQSCKLYQSWLVYFRKPLIKEDFVEYAEKNDPSDGTEIYEDAPTTDIKVFDPVNQTLPLFLQRKLCPTVYEDIKNAIREESSRKTFDNTEIDDEGCFLVHVDDMTYMFNDPETHEHLRDLPHHGINVTIKNVNYIRERCSIPAADTYVELLYRMLKFVQPCPHKSRDVKKVLDLMCGHYVVDFDSEVTILDLYCDYIDANKMVVDIDEFVDIVRYCGWVILDRSVKGLRKEKRERYKSLSKKEKDMYGMQQVFNRNLDLRAMPVVEFNDKLSLWNMPSLL